MPAKLQAAHDKLSSDFNGLVKRLGDTEDHSQQQATGYRRWPSRRQY